MKPKFFIFRHTFFALLLLPAALQGAGAKFTREMVAGVILLDKPEYTKTQCFAAIDGYSDIAPGPLYTAEDVKGIRNALASGSLGGTGPDSPKIDDPDTAPKIEKKLPLWGVKIRQDYNDVTGDEDPSLNDAKKTRRDQLAGASLSYTRDYNGNHNNWSAQGALIRPFKIHENLNGFSKDDPYFLLRTAYLVPSVSVHKVTSETNSDDDIDSLIFRLGAVGRFSGLSEKTFHELEVRGYMTYGTDTSFDSSTFAGEFDIEPRFVGLLKNANKALGFPTSLIPGPGGPDGLNSNFDYHLRLFLHGEAGEVNDPGKDSDLLEGDFFRMGPVLKLEVQPSGLARALGKKSDGIKLFTSYSYLPTISGNDNGHDYLFSAGIDWSLLEGDDRDISLKVLYEKGGLELTKKEIETLTVGLGITF